MPLLPHTCDAGEMQRLEKRKLICKCHASSTICTLCGKILAAGYATQTRALPRTASRPIRIADPMPAHDRVRCPSSRSHDTRRRTTTPPPMMTISPFNLTLGRRRSHSSPIEQRASISPGGCARKAGSCTSAMYSAKARCVPAASGGVRGEITIGLGVARRALVVIAEDVVGEKECVSQPCRSRAT